MAYKFLVLAPLVAALATTFPEVIPGPGLPSLLELGLTSKDLHTMTPAFRKYSLWPSSAQESHAL